METANLFIMKRLRILAGHMPPVKDRKILFFIDLQDVDMMHSRVCPAIPERL
jgi:hypothetical protein